MALSVQSDDGTQADANAYIALAAFKSYHDARGNSYVGFTDDQMNAAIVRATDYVDARFTFRGIKLLAAQTTMWPRQAGDVNFIPWQDLNFSGVSPYSYDIPTSFVALVDLGGAKIVGIPLALKNATAEYAFRALSIPLFQDAPAAEGGRIIDSETVKVDVIEQTISWAPSQGTGGFQMPAFPAADLMLARAGLITIGRTLFR
jgi:hypothetical protein